MFIIMASWKRLREREIERERERERERKREGERETESLITCPWIYRVTKSENGKHVPKASHQTH